MKHLPGDGSRGSPPLSGVLRWAILPRPEEAARWADFEEAIFHMRATTKWVKARESFDSAQELPCR
jgi:hypothetical protein